MVLIRIPVILAFPLYIISHCRPKLKEHMKYCADNPEEINKLTKVQGQVDQVKGVMMGNIEKVRNSC